MRKILDKVVLVFKIPELRKKIIFVLAAMIIFRIAANIPVPGINVEQLRQFFANNQLFGLRQYQNKGSFIFKFYIL